MKSTATAPRDQHGLAYYGLDDQSRVIPLNGRDEWEVNDQKISKEERDVVKSDGVGEFGVVTRFDGRAGSFAPDGKPYLWYTEVIKPVEPNDATWEILGAYTTIDQAKKGHDLFVREVEKALAKGKDPFMIRFRCFPKHSYRLRDFF